MIAKDKRMPSQRGMGYLEERRKEKRTGGLKQPEQPGLTILQGDLANKLASREMKSRQELIQWGCER